MLRKSLGTLLLVLGVFSLTACASGPRRLSRNWDDWVNQKYTEGAWVHGALLQDILPVYPVVGLVLTVGDILFVNPYYFWSKDAWDNKGTGYDHEALEGATRSVTGSGL
jgi:hypothetical protein